MVFWIVELHLILIFLAGEKLWKFALKSIVRKAKAFFGEKLESDDDLSSDDEGSKDEAPGELGYVVNEVFEEHSREGYGDDTLGEADVGSDDGPDLFGALEDVEISWNDG